MTWAIAYESRGDFSGTPQFLIWVLLFTAQLVIWTGGFFVVVPELLNALEEVNLSWRWRPICELAAFLLALFVFSLSILPAYDVLREEAPFTNAFDALPSADDWPLMDYARKMVPLTLIGILLALLAVAGMMVVRRGFLAQAAQSTVTMSDLIRFVELRKHLLRFLAVAGVAIGIGTLVIGALRQAAEVSNRPSLRADYCASLRERGELNELDAAYCNGIEQPKHEQSFDAQFVVLFGLYYSALLMLAYAPAYSALVAAGKNLVAAAPRETAKDFASAQKDIQAVESALQLDISAGTTFKSAASVFAPLFGSLVALLLGTK